MLNVIESLEDLVLGVRQRLDVAPNERGHDGSDGKSDDGWHKEPSAISPLMADDDLLVLAPV